MSFLAALGQGLLGGQSKYQELNQYDDQQRRLAEEQAFRQSQAQQEQENFLRSFGLQQKQFDFGRERAGVEDDRWGKQFAWDQTVGRSEMEANDIQQRLARLGLEHFETPEERHRRAVEMEEVRGRSMAGRYAPEYQRINEFQAEALNRHASILGVPQIDAGLTQLYRQMPDAVTPAQRAQIDAAIAQLSDQRAQLMQAAAQAVYQEMREYNDPAMQRFGQAMAGPGTGGTSMGDNRMSSLPGGGRPLLGSSLGAPTGGASGLNMSIIPGTTPPPAVQEPPAAPRVRNRTANNMADMSAITEALRRRRADTKNRAPR